MNENLFHLSTQHWSVFLLLSLIPALINVGIFIYVYFFFPGNKTNSVFSIFVLLLAFAQLADGFVHISASEATAAHWGNISVSPWGFISSCGLLFTLRLTGWQDKISGRLLYILLCFPAAIATFMTIGGLNEFTLIYSETWGWILNPKPVLTTNIIFIVSSLPSLVTFVLQWMYCYKNRSDRKTRIKALLIASGFTIPMIGANLFEVIFPLVLGQKDIPITTPLITVFSLTSFIAIRWFRLFDFSPKHQWQRIVESMNEGMLIVNNRDEIMYANQSFCRVMEYEFEEIKGKVAHRLFVSEPDRTNIQDAIRERRKKKSGQYEIQLRTKSGNNIWMLMNGSPYYDDRGKVIGSIGIQTNIQQLKDNESKIRQSELRLKRAQEVAHVGSWEINFATGIAIWSEEACRIYGLAPDQSEQSFDSWISFIHPEDLESVIATVKKSERSLEANSFDHRILRHDGTIRYIHSSFEFEVDPSGKPVGLFGVCHDITSHIELERIRQESEQQMKSFVDNSLLSIYAVDIESRKIVYANAALLHLVGYTREEIDSTTIYDFINQTSPEPTSKEEIDERFEITIKKGKASVGERTWKTKDGKMVHLLVSAFAQERNGKPCIYITAQDISEMKLAQEKLDAANKELETYIYKASHDLRTPLCSIIGLINASKFEIKDATSIRYLEMIESLTKKLDNTLTTLVRSMTISEMEKFSDVIHFEELITEVAQRFEYTKGYSRINITTDISFSSTFISNKTILESIFQNMIGNAIKYQNFNGTDPYLHIDVSENDKEVKLVFADNGIGIEKSMQQRVFDMYFRATDAASGSGLGLYLVKKGVEKLDGSVSLTSEPGKGTTFTILLSKQRGIPQSIAESLSRTDFVLKKMAS